MDPEKLNEDQRRTVKLLPGYEAAQRELTEVKKAIEVSSTSRRVFTVHYSIFILTHQIRSTRRNWFKKFKLSVLRLKLLRRLESTVLFLLLR